MSDLGEEDEQRVEREAVLRKGCECTLPELADLDLRPHDSPFTPTRDPRFGRRKAVPANKRSILAHRLHRLSRQRSAPQRR